MCYESGCSAVGSARGLGACDRLVSRPPNAHKISVFLSFSRFSAVFMFGKKLLTTDLTTYGFDFKNWISGCRVTVTRLLWEQVQAGSTPVIPTKNQPKMRLFAPLSADFLLIIGAFAHHFGKFTWRQKNGLCCNRSTSRFFIFSEGFFFAYCNAKFRGWPLRII